MFRIGEFSKIAQVSGRLLRYYDEIGLLKPQHTDEWTGYRYYTVDQLPHLNRILALKELGLSLEQIQHLLDSSIGTDEVRSLYLAHKAQLEQSLRDELARLRQVQLRLDLLDRHATGWMPDVVMKRIPAQSALTYRDTHMAVEQLYQLFGQIAERFPQPSSEKAKYGALFTVLYSDILVPEAPMDLEIGVLFYTEHTQPLTLDNGITLTPHELPVVEQMATVVHRGLEDHPITYNALGRWLEQQHYRIVGPGRELVLEDYDPAEPETCIMEIQFPVERIKLGELDFLESIH